MNPLNQLWKLGLEDKETLGWGLVIMLLGTLPTPALTGTLPTAHPRLWITAADLPRLRALAADTRKGPLGFVPAEAFATIKQEADHYLQEAAFTYRVSMPGLAGGPAKEWSYTLSDEAPPRHDDYAHYPCWTGMSRALETRLVALSFACLVAQEQPYFDKAKRMVLSLCRWPIPWTDPSYGNPGACLDTSHLSTAVALFYDWCYDDLTEEERALIRQALGEKAVAGLMKAIPDYGAVGWPNGFAVLTSALGLCALALQGEEEAAAGWLSQALASAKEFFDTQGKDGGCMEGPGYGTYGADTLAHFLLALETAKVPHPLLDHPFFVTLPQYAISQMCPTDKQHTGFGDCWFVQPFPLCLTLLALRGNAEAVWYLHEIGYVQPRMLQQFLTIALHPEAFAAPQPPEWNPSRAYVDIGYASLRDGFNPQAAFMAFKCGPPTRVVGHNHYDHNSFQIHFNGAWIATDPGYTGYFDPPDNKYGRCTFGHNTITLDVDEAYLRNMGFPLLGHDQMRLNGGRIAAHHSSPGFDYVKGVAAEAYNPPTTGAYTCVHFWQEGEGSGFARIEGPRPDSPEWKQYEFSGPAPEGAATFCLALEFSGAGGSVWYDDAELWVDGKKLDLPNPSFEEGTDEEFKGGKGGWQSRAWAPDAGRHEIDTHVAHSGKRSARIDAPGGYYYWLPEKQPLPIQPGQQITARFWARCLTPPPVMERADREVLFIKPYVFVIRDALAAPEPHAYSFVLHTLGSVEVTGPHQAVLTAPGTARLETHVFSPAGITLTSGLYPGAEQRGPYLNGTTGPVKSTAITSVLIARQAAFQLTNPGFEAGMRGWTPRNVEGYLENHVIDEQEKHSGQKSGRIDSPGGYYYTPRFRVEPGARITVRFWAKIDGQEDRWATVYWWHQGKLNLNATGQEAGPLLSGNEWKRYEFTATVPPDVVEACVAFNYFGAGHAWYDDVEVSLDPTRPILPPGRVMALEEGQRGVVIELDGLRHLVVFPEETHAVAIAGHEVVCDGGMACITLDAQEKPVAAWLLDGTELRLDGQVVSAVQSSSVSGSPG